MSTEILTLPDVARLLKIAEKTVYTLARQKELPAFKVRGQWRFRRVDLDSWLEQDGRGGESRRARARTSEAGHRIGRHVPTPEITPIVPPARTPAGKKTRIPPPVAVPDDGWFMSRAEARAVEAFGISIGKAGTHQSKTMMLAEIRTYFANPDARPEQARTLIVEQDILCKRTVSTRSLSLRHLDKLYGIATPRPLTCALAALWRSDDEGQSLLALLCALASDPLLRDSAAKVLDTPIGIPVRSPDFSAIWEEKNPKRFSPATLQSLSRNCASSWTQSGHLRGALQKERRPVAATPVTAAFAALIAEACGFGGQALLASPWMRVLDLTPDAAFDLLRAAAAHGLVRLRAAGDVVELVVRKPMAERLGVAGLAEF